MEEDKKKIPTKKQVSNRTNNSNVLPGIGIVYREKENKGGNFSLPARISNFLTGNMIATPQSVANKFDNQVTIKDLFTGESIPGETMDGSIDRDGNLVKLSAMQNRVIFSLSKQIFSKESKEVTEYLELLKQGENPEQLPKMYISLSDISADVFGEEERGKFRNIKDIYKTLEKISGIRVPQVYYTETFTDDKGVEHSFSFRRLIPYIRLTGYENQIIVDNRYILPSSVQIECSRIFYERNWIGKDSRNFLLTNDVLEARLPSGRKITTDVYWSGLFPLAANYSWYYYWHKLKAVEKKIKSENITERAKIAQLKEDALTTPSISFQRIRDAINFKSKFRQDEARFKKQLWEGMWALIDRGVITEKSNIDWENETFHFVFNENREPLNKPGTKKEDEKKPGGKWATYSPNIKRGRKKEISKGKKASVFKEPELFPEKV